MFAWRASRALMVLLGLVTFAACESSTAVAVSADVASSLSIAVDGTVPTQGGALLLEVGDTLTVTALATNALGLPVTTGPVSWSSSDANVVEIDASGLVTATGVGTAEIRAVSGEAESSLSAVVSES